MRTARVPGSNPGSGFRNINQTHTQKVQLENGYKDYYSIADVERAKAVIKYEKDNDTETAKGWAEMAVIEALKTIDGRDWHMETLKAEAHTSRNRNAWNVYGEDTQQMDVWIDATARTGKGFIMVGAYLSDIWQIGAEEITDRMYIRYFTEK